MKKKYLIILFVLLVTSHTIAQNQLFKGNNLLLPSNLIINYVVRLDTCYRMLNGVCVDSVSKAYLSNNQKNDLFGIILENALSGKSKCYKTESWLSYQLMENRDLISVQEMYTRLNLTSFHLFDLKELIGLNFIEEWEVTNNPLAFNKKVIAFMPLRRYYKDDDTLFENPQFQIPFTVIDTLGKKSQIRKSDKRMVLTNEIASEYFFYLDYGTPYDIAQLVKIYNKSKQNLSDQILNKETSEYLSKSGIVNFLKVVIGKVIKGELKAYNYYDNQQLTIDEVEEKMGVFNVAFEKDSLGEISSREYKTPIEFDEIQSVVFLEKWYIDPVALRIKKTVVGIAPVRFYYNDDDEYQENLIRKILFKVYFDEKERF